MSTATPAPASSCWDDADPPGRAAPARTVDVPGSLRLATAERATQTCGCDERLSAISACRHVPHQPNTLSRAREQRGRRCDRQDAIASDRQQRLGADTGSVTDREPARAPAGHCDALIRCGL